ncbi:UDP-galactopyranose mutase [Candidatus Desantisbacteria bacterium CG_4_10_14_0_8_um_filter_48_22]|uniref:UDP-galactopyranose mutase n=1 Tax=Candidatus Desantisbacteria bacterium CG_4_10_14_0_8_um_filter_48_22 TaxID=1974543 RepID=A0A2M7S5D3_9BACT|nr:MAG: UDP-galactopyranose mutase [Candidatus Desantisbacteria bacterium CG1_02_49_89]PIV56337.1 MAG: UDP-galactopyranose mutase [Candidatus Desantisbacteria bacterium CG02_land_8_20_14_3_00_49_13]PIZ14538.1 MAG: UDP-galactopyranose mutase [Candidatus Desantisbacteria bacterium CG_4_10_14_0_8_um_filter_48_22]
MDAEYVVVGAGFAGSVMAERIASVLNKKVLVIDKRGHIGGNCYDCPDEHGILIHKYGPHIFHTVNEEAWNYVSNFTEWNLYQHEVLAFIDGHYAPVPFNLNSIRALFPGSFAQKLENKLLEKFGFNKKVPILDLRKADDADLKFLADYVYEKVFLHYTEKQWGMKPEDLSPEVTGRVPVFVSRDNRYFQDRFQGMPVKGYTPVFEKMLSNRNIRVDLNTDYRKVRGQLKYKKLIYTGPVDEFFEYKFGKLPYRSLDFGFENHKKEFYQDASVINYPNDYGFTRITEFKRLTWQKADSTTIIKEFSKACEKETDIPYYPIPADEPVKLYKKYEEEAKNNKNVIFLGRLAQYKYYNMDAIIASSLARFKELKVEG